MIRGWFRSRSLRIRRMQKLRTGYGRAADSGTEGTKYGMYNLHPAESALCWVGGGLAGYAIGYLFYNHPIPAMLCALSGLWVPGWLRRTRIRKRKEELARQFRQALYALVSSLTAGRAVENAFSAAVKDLRLIYTDPGTYILIEFERIDNKIRNGETVEAALLDFGRRSELDELLQFTEVFSTCKRTGGNLAEVMRRTAHIIGEKMEVRQEIGVMLAQKRFESKILGVAPLAVIGLLQWSSPDYMEPLYGNAAGALIMSVCLAVFLGCWVLAGKWMELKL
ncbi:type II secretion system F family protein [Gorillibacterium sp. sgz5001074]|uniref:type II secretion system F family protein n=1 Tax=Gorillibacterium sp. sgz5001074 TaxID=3446695 RepID=UPI003F67A3DF